MCRTILTLDRAPSYVARNTDGDIVGVLISERYCHDYSDNIHPFSPIVTLPLEYAPVADVAKKLEKQIVDKYPEIISTQTLHLFTAGVVPEYRKHKIAMKLFEKIISKAKEEGFKYAISECSTAGSQHILKDDFQFEIGAQVHYDTYEFQGKRVFADAMDPNNPLSADSYMALVLKLDQ